METNTFNHLCGICTTASLPAGFLIFGMRIKGCNLAIDGIRQVFYLQQVQTTELLTECYSDKPVGHQDKLNHQHAYIWDQVHLQPSDQQTHSLADSACPDLRKKFPGRLSVPVFWIGSPIAGLAERKIHFKSSSFMSTSFLIKQM